MVAEHLVLAALVRCTLASMDYSARNAGLDVVGSGRAHGTVTKRAADGLYAFVDIQSELEIELDPAPLARSSPSRSRRLSAAVSSATR